LPIPLKTRISRYLKNPALVVRSPGRVNIIGEHTDYNDGFVLPAAIDKAAYVAVGRRSDGAVHLYAEEFKERFETTVDALAPSTGAGPITY
jgi:galactokinase